MTTTIDNSKLQRVYAEADASGRSTLSKLFDNSILSPSITDRIKSYLDARAVLNRNMPTPAGTSDEIAYAKLKVIIEALNEGWKPDWSDTRQYKYYPYFNMKNDFSLDNVICYYRSSHVGSRLCFKSEALAKYAAVQFIDMYKAFYLV